ncbi:MAG: hypothetical protein IKS19_03980 [Clostridia bacterium]|nr:hypothetical protein [Clostridia bacterium]
MKKMTAAVLAALAMFFSVSCSSARFPEQLPASSAEESAQSVEIAYNETSGENESQSPEEAPVISDADRTRIADMMLYLMALGASETEEWTHFEPSDERMMSFAWAAITDGKYDFIAKSETEKGVYKRADLNEKIFIPIFGKEINSFEQQSFPGWETTDRSTAEYYERHDGIGGEIRLGDILINSVVKNEDDTLTVAATTANGSWQGIRYPMEKVLAVIEASQDSPFGYSFKEIQICGNNGTTIPAGSVEASSRLTISDTTLMPESLFDTDVRTVWAEGAQGSGAREYVKVYPNYTDQTSTVWAIGIVNGNMSDYIPAADDQLHRTEYPISRSFAESGRARRISISLSDGSTGSYELPGYDVPSVRPYVIMFNSPVRPSWIKISIDAAKEGEGENGSDIYLSEIYLYK